jgi:GTPase SAR1 family protein
MIFAGLRLTNELSFNNVGEWLTSIQQFGSDSVARVLIANKCDLAHRAVSTVLGQQTAREADIKFFECEGLHKRARIVLLTQLLPLECVSSLGKEA